MVQFENYGRGMYYSVFTFVSVA